MTPLNMTYIRDDYKNTMKLSFEEAEKMAFITKGYAYAYQVLGKYMWDSGKKPSPLKFCKVSTKSYRIRFIRKYGMNLLLKISGSSSL